MKTLSIIIPVYNAAEHLAETLRSVSSQILPQDWALEVIVIDDGSTDQSVNIATHFPDRRIRLINTRENRGRACARNTGLGNASGTHCLFIDADCSYTDQNVVQTYISYFERGIRACFGTVTAAGNGFWERYQRENYRQRRSRGQKLNLITTQNFGAEKALLESVGGFDEAYQKYGFEDRDLYLTLLAHLSHTAVQIDPDLKVYHRDRICLDQVCLKMFEAGRCNASIFKKKFPHEYQGMSYARVDIGLVPDKATPLCRFIIRYLENMREIGNRVLQSQWIPYPAKRIVVKGLSALYYMAGTDAS